MSRLSIAFVLALFFHLALSVIPWSPQRHILPQPTGDTAITIHFADAAARAPASRQREKISTNKPAEIPVSQTKSSNVPAVKSVEKARKPSAARILQPRVKKVVQPIEKALAAPSSSAAGKSAFPPTNPGKNGPTSQGTPPVAKPAIIKAQPLYDQNPKPPYPPLARKRGWQGTVILSVMVLENGFPAQLSVKKSCGYDLLDKTALATVQRWHFLPGTKNNVPTSMEVLVPVRFLLQ